MTVHSSRTAYHANEAERDAVGLHYRFEAGTQTDSPIALLVHGRAGDCDVPWVFRRCFPKDVHVLSVQAPFQDPLGGYSWWPDYASAYKDSSFAHTIAEQTLDAFDRLLDYEGLEPRACYALGFSQGAALLSCTLQLHPELFEKIALLAGLCIPVGVLPTNEHGLQDGKSSVLWVHGSDDDVIPASRAQEGQELLRSYGFPVELLVETGVGHKVGIQGMRRLKDYFA